MSDKDATISIIVPVYNDAGTLAELCAGIVQAIGDRDPFEIILVNDGSTDISARPLDALRHRTLAPQACPDRSADAGADGDGSPRSALEWWRDSRPFWRGKP